MFTLIDLFESKISDFFGAPYGVATDSCTHALELCLRLKNIKKTRCPEQTYLSVPMTLTKLNIDWSWKKENWFNYYYLEDTNIVDAAVYWKEKSYIKNTMMCLSFQFKKHLNLGRGGMILLDDYDDYRQLIKMSYDGRERHTLWAEQNIDTLGYHYYMTPETAQTGLEKFEMIKNQAATQWDYKCYPDLSKLKVFKNVK